MITAVPAKPGGGATWTDVVAIDSNARGVRGGSLYTIPRVAGLELHHRWGNLWRTDMGLRCALQ